MWDSAKEVGKKVRDRAIETGQKGLRLPGIEPGASRWQRDILPLNQKRKLVLTKLTTYHTYLRTPCFNQRPRKRVTTFSIYFLQKNPFIHSSATAPSNHHRIHFSQRTRTSHSRTYIIIKHISSLTFNSDFFVSKLETRI